VSGESKNEEQNPHKEKKVRPLLPWRAPVKGLAFNKTRQTRDRMQKSEQKKETNFGVSLRRKEERATPPKTASGAPTENQQHRRLGKKAAAKKDTEEGRPRSRRPREKKKRKTKKPESPSHVSDRGVPEGCIRR